MAHDAGVGGIRDVWRLLLHFCLVQGLALKVEGSGFRVQGSGFRVQGSEFRVQGSGFRG